MSSWKEIKRPFRNALIAAFKWDSLANVLEYQCDDRRLDTITSKSEGFNKNVDDVIADAVQTGWLEKLAKGALAENDHAALKATVPQILAGVEAEGKDYYQKTPDHTADAPPQAPGEQPDQPEQTEEDRSRFDGGAAEPPPQDVSGLWNRYSDFGASVGGGCLATLLAAAITTIAAYALRSSAANPEQALDIVVTITVVIGLVVAVAAYRSSRRNLAIGAIVFTLGLVLFHFVVDWCGPWCTDTPIQLEYESTDTSRRIVQGNTISVGPGSEIRVFAVPFGENINEDRFVCEWEYVGDGEAKADGCQVLITTGEDGEGDAVTAVVRQSGCDYYARESAFIMPAVGEGG